MTTLHRILLICFIAGFSWQIPECSGGAEEFDGYIATITLTKGDGRHEYSSDIKAITIYKAGEISSTVNIQVLTGDTIGLRCRLEAHGTWFLDNDVRQEWEFRDNDAGRETISRNGKKVIDNRRIRVKENRDKYEWTVTLKNTKKSDSGRWNCFISPDRFGTRVVARANVQIFDTLASTSGPALAPCNGTTEDTRHDIKKSSCEEITEDNINLCPDLTYTKIGLPNLLGHQTQTDATKALSKLLLSVSQQDFDCPMQEFACHTYLPPCRESALERELIVPCRMICERARQACEKSITWPVLPELSCNNFPLDYGSYYRCWEPKDGILGDKLPCQQVPSSMCRQLGFRYTRIQENNPFEHTDIDEALEAFNDKELQKLISTGCSSELASFVCASFFPPCIDGEVTKPCNKVCRRNWKACKHDATTLGLDKHEVFRCGKRYPAAPPVDVYSSYYEKHEKCLMNIQAPISKPKINDITRLRTSIVFYTSSSDEDVASFLVSTYKLSLPESVLHPTPKSQYHAYKWTWLGVDHDWQGEIQIGDPDAVSGSTPLDPEASYFVTVQAQNTFGNGPMTVVALPKYDAQRLLFYSSVTPDRVNWLDELDQNLTFFRLQYKPNQIICVNLDTGNQNSPQWVMDDCIVSPYEGADDVTKTSSLSTEMTLLNIATKDYSSLTCTIRGLQATVTTSFVKCERAENYICRSNGDYTILPNSLGHAEQQESEMTSYVFLRFLRHGCANDTSSLMDFVCLAYAPSVDTCDGDIKRIVPCREVCEMAYEACQDDMESIEFEWPAEASCDNFPSMYEDDTCHMPGIPDEQNDGEIIDSDKLKTNETSKSCEFKTRRYDVTDFGVPYLFSGWTDVQGQGAANDFCRVVRNSIRSFLSCALAGSEGHSEYQFNSPNALIDEFEPGHMDTWYMKDEDGDGRDDYCRCVGNIPDTHVSCMKAGDSGFQGHYDFTPKGTPQPCHFVKVNQYFGPPPS